jgi:UDP:flavonoid glycosyltransferase YjiC (YdhE family)
VGDVLPFVPVCRELMRRQHSVALGAPPIFRSNLRRSGVPTVAAGPFLRRERRARFEAAALDTTGRSLIRHAWTELVCADAAEVVAALDDLVADCDVVLGHYHSLAAYVLATKHHRPLATLSWGPACVPSDAYPPSTALLTADTALASSITVGIGDGSFGTARAYLNGQAWAEEADWVRRELDGASDAVLARFGLPPLDTAWLSLPLAGDAALLACDPALFRAPRDWPAHVEQVGYPYYDALAGTSVAELVAFANAGPPPVLVSFGTAVAGGIAADYRLVVDVLTRIGRRVIVLGAPEGVVPGPAVSVAGYAPIASLVDQCSFVVHHAGPGTMHASLTAGLPAVAIPRSFDQPLNAAALAASGAGVALRPGELSASSLVAAFAEVDSSDARLAAAAMGAALRRQRPAAEVIADGVERVPIVRD